MTMHTITVTELSATDTEWEFEVVVEDEEGESRHEVRVPREYYEKLTAGGAAAADELVRESFEFLLERESKEDILSSFELPVIAQYFPEYETEIAGHFE